MTDNIEKLSSRYTGLRGRMIDLTNATLTRSKSADLMRRLDGEEIDRIADILGDIAAIETDAGSQISFSELADAAARDPNRKAGELVFWEYQSLRDDDRWHGLNGWPECECGGCGCDEPATTTDDSSIPVCGACSEYTCDDDGDVRCSNMDDVEIVTESCGAGNQTRSYARLKPPAMPGEDPDGEWACYWETVGDDSHVVSRHGTREDAEQAVASHDFPRPGDHTQYLCGYVTRELVADRWVTPEEE